MIELHRIGHKQTPFHLNPDLIVTIESCPDTVIGLSTGAKIVVAESPEEVALALRDWRVEILSVALARPRPLRGPGEVRRLREPAPARPAEDPAGASQPAQQQPDAAPPA